MVYRNCDGGTARLLAGYVTGALVLVLHFSIEKDLAAFQTSPGYCTGLCDPAVYNGPAMNQFCGGA